MNQEQKNLIEQAWKKYKIKYLLSKFLFVSINVFIFSASALLIVLNLFTLKYNQNFPEIKGVFISLAVITGVGTFFISIMSAFQWKDKKEKYTNQIIAIAKIYNYKGEINNEEFFKLLDELEITLTNEKP
ncbi:MAG: hypothetical protein KFW07_02335 [Mycoplasmataceae bacterium]|nr:hypothetical protein [Mycoplasmataceae bacterium]